MSPASNRRANTGGRQRERQPAEERAEHLMERVSSEVTRFVSRVAGRTREEFEDILAEARTVKERWSSSNRN